MRKSLCTSLLLFAALPWCVAALSGCTPDRPGDFICKTGEEVTYTMTDVSYRWSWPADKTTTWTLRPWRYADGTTTLYVQRPGENCKVYLKR